MSGKSVISNYGPYSIGLLLLFVVASIEHSLAIAIELVLKVVAFCLSLLFPVMLSARLATLEFSKAGGPEKILRLDIAICTFIAIQVLLWAMDLYQLQWYIITISLAVFVVTLLIFFTVRKYK